ncbi:uncharacterized protein KY384_009268 [Bacidia gigantensis]|uniref:uncharacterized protein n=1 Tax=Bacidia gigantensis TaxID=2732470 RepID=UPI001D05069D|nr:uncharacterized protein KY384_009268 [Bacidia gigantensis]KAG8525624.1 hypothetical protein KY384_009268 [Bacidia gigantensis]
MYNLIFTTTLLLILLASHSRAQAQDPKANDITNNGDYLIARCGKGIQGGKADQLISLLRSIGGDLPTINVEANLGEDSIYGFKSLFTNNENIAAVTETYGKLSDAETVVVNGQATRVTFVCLELGDFTTASIYNTILTNQRRAAAFNEFGSEKIYLTPFFFEVLKRNPEPYRCPLFRKNRIAVNFDDILGTTQYGIIIHELVDKYLHFENLLQAEVYDLKDCIKLSADQQLKNAENFNMFASGRLFEVSTMMNTTMGQVPRILSMNTHARAKGSSNTMLRAVAPGGAKGKDVPIDWTRKLVKVLL